MNLFTKQKKTSDIKNKCMVTKGEIVGEGGKNQELGVKTHTLLYTR